MNMMRPCVKDEYGRVQRPISIQRLLEWAFADECASIDFEDPGTIAEGYKNVGAEWVMIQRAELGCKVDGGGRSDPDYDAELVASALAVLPEGCGGRRMAVRVAELARARMVPDTHVGEVPKCLPSDWHQNRHGKTAKTEHVEFLTEVGPRKVKRFESRVCPVIYRPAPQSIAMARREYITWWLSLLELRQTFEIYNNLSRWRVTTEMPTKFPWKKSC